MDGLEICCASWGWSKGSNPNRRTLEQGVPKTQTPFPSSPKKHVTSNFLQIWGSNYGSDCPQPAITCSGLIIAFVKHPLPLWGNNIFKAIQGEKLDLQCGLSKTDKLEKVICASEAGQGSCKPECLQAPGQQSKWVATNLEQHPRTASLSPAFAAFGDCAFSTLAAPCLCSAWVFSGSFA